MHDNDIERAIENAAASVEMEGFHIDDQCREWCRQALQREITKEEYIKRVFESVGVSIPCHTI